MPIIRRDYIQVSDLIYGVWNIDLCSDGKDFMKNKDADLVFLDIELAEGENGNHRQSVFPEKQASKSNMNDIAVIYEKSNPSNLKMVTYAKPSTFIVQIMPSMAERIK